MPENRKLLVLSEDEKMHKRVSRRLKKKPYYEVEWTSSWDEAFEKVTEKKVDFLFYEVGKALNDGMKKLDKMKAANDMVPVVVSAVLDMPPPPPGMRGERPPGR